MEDVQLAVIVDVKAVMDILHAVQIVLNIGAAVAMVVAVAMEAAGQCAIQYVKVVMVIVILITQDSTYSSIFRAGNGK